MDNKINKILLPTDLGELGDFAYNMASHIAKEAKATIEVVSVVPGPQGAIYSQSGTLLNDDGNDYSEWGHKLEENKLKMKEWVKDKAYISESYSVIGIVNDSIIQYAKDHEIDLIIMGTDGVFTNKLWGHPSHAQFISNHSPIPVLSLKCDRSNIHLKEIVFAGDFLVAKKMDLEIMKSIQAVFNSKILLLKIKTEDAIRSVDQINSDMEAYAKANDLTNYSIHIFDDKDAESGIGNFASEKDIDLILLGTHQGTGFSKLFRRSVSDDIVKHLFHPVLTFPID